VCGKQKNLTLLAFVVIAPDSFEQRALIRSTWGSKVFKRLRVIFALALSKDDAINEKIRNEFEVHKDIIQEDFIDSYYNLTSKILMGFRWVHEYCSGSYFTMRINDDVVVNTVRLLDFLDDFRASRLKNNKKLENEMIGYVIYGARPFRNPKSKFYISKKQFNGATYDWYCEGSAYIFTTDLAKKFYDYSLDFYYPPFSSW
jgi:hypothetical protein